MIGRLLLTSDLSYASPDLSLPPPPLLPRPLLTSTPPPSTSSCPTSTPTSPDLDSSRPPVFVDFSYTGHIEITVDNAQDLLSAGSMFQFPDLSLPPPPHPHPRPLPTSTPPVLQSVVDFSYTGHIEITVDNAQDLLSAGSMFQYPDIVTACCEFLSAHMSSTNCLGIEQFAAMHSCRLVIS